MSVARTIGVSRRRRRRRRRRVRVRRQLDWRQERPRRDAETLQKKPDKNPGQSRHQNTSLRLGLLIA